MIRSLIFLAALSLACSSSPARTPETGPADLAVVDGDQKALRAVVAPLVTPHVDPVAAETDPAKTVGMVVAVLGIKSAGVYGFGATELGGSRVPDGRTLYQIGSVSKAFTGLVLAGELVKAGGLKRTALVEGLIPSLKGANGVKGVTLGMLAAHYSGLAVMPSNLPKKDPLSPAEGYTMAALKSYLFSLSSPVVAGKAYVYSNTGLGLLGLCLEAHHKVTGHHALLQTALLKNLGQPEMWGQVASVPAAAMARVAQGYAPKGGKRAAGRLGQMGVLAGAGEMVTTGDVMLAWLRIFTGREYSPLKAAVVEWIKPIKPMPGGGSIALGIEVQPGVGGAGATYAKAGNVAGGYSAYLAFRRSPGVGVVVLTNVANYIGVKSTALAILDKLAVTR